MMEDIWARYALHKPQADEKSTILLLPSVGRCPRTVHVLQKLSTHTLGTFHLRRELHKAGLIRVNLGIEVCPRDVDRADLRPIGG